MKKHKSQKIKEVIHQSDEDLNLHEIKARTGAGNGYKHHTPNNHHVETAKEISDSDPIHKSHKITNVINEHDGNLKLHEIKAKTGAGSGHKHHHPNDNDVETEKEVNIFNKTYKSDKIKDVIEEHDGDLNLHEIKAKTGAGSGHKH